MGACASFPKGMKKKAQEAQLPEQPKDVEPFAAVAADMAKVDKDIVKVDGEGNKEQDGDKEKAIESPKKEGEITAATNTAPIEEETKLSVSETKAENDNALVAPVTSDENKETAEIKDEK